MKSRNCEIKYLNRIPFELVNDLEVEIVTMLLKHKKYQDKSYTARQLAQDLHTNSRYISAVLHLRFKCNYTTLVNRYRVADARMMLADKRYAACTVAEIGSIVGFANRQSFYTAFKNEMNITPNEYREKVKS